MVNLIDFIKTGHNRLNPTVSVGLTQLLFTVAARKQMEHSMQSNRA